MWLKYKTKWSSGIDKEWSWRDLVHERSEESIQEYIHDICEEHNWSEHFRGIDYEVIEYPPMEILERTIKETTSLIDLRKKYLKYLKELEKQLKEKTP